MGVRGWKTRGTSRYVEDRILTESGGSKDFGGVIWKTLGGV